MEKAFQKGGAAYVAGLIAEGVRSGRREAVITGNREIKRAIRIPGDFKLILENCHLRMADGVYDNLFVNEHHGTEAGGTPAGTDRNITIEGRGEAILDGGNYNGLSEKNAGQDGLPPIWKNNLLLFTNVDGFHISGVSCRNQRWWAMNFIYCANGVIRKADFCADDTRIDENGAEHHGLERALYDQTRVKNADGIDLREGCHHIIIEDITGFTEDDSIALTALHGAPEETFAVAGLSPDLCHIIVRNVRTAAFCTNVRLLNQGEIKLHDILINGVTDVGRESPHIDQGLFAVRVGDKHLYGSRASTKEETYNIIIRNVYGAGRYALALAGEIGNLVTENIRCAEGTGLLKDERNVNS